MATALAFGLTTVTRTTDRHQVVVISTDSRCAQSWTTGSATLDQQATPLLQAVACRELRHNCRVRPDWIPGVTNTVADHLSRGRTVDSLDPAKQLSITPVWLDWMTKSLTPSACRRYPWTFPGDDFAIRAPASATHTLPRQPCHGVCPTCHRQSSW